MKFAFQLLSVAVAACATSFVSAFVGGQHQAALFRNEMQSARRIEKTKVNCICIDCKWVTSCQAYHFVETKHNQPHMTENPSFMPQDGSPTIHVNVRTIRTEEDRKKEAERMWSEHQSETERAEAVADPDSDESLVGAQKYDLGSATTYEYDVVKCADYDHDPGCWVRNMPEEIKLANPDFVPS